jgi:hypothetical protein
MAILGKKFPTANKTMLEYFVGLFQDLQKKAKNAEISTASIDLRGIIDALDMISIGYNPNKAVKINVTNNCFEEYERAIVQDVVNTRISQGWTSNDIFPKANSIVVDFSTIK